MSPKIRFNGYTDAWVHRKLGDVVDIMSGGTPSSSIKEYWNGDINWFSPSEIGNDKYVSKSNKTISELGMKKSSAKLLPRGTVLFTSRASIGDMAILTDVATTNQGFQSLVPIDGKTTTLFIYAMKDQLKNYGLAYSNGSTFQEVSNKAMKVMPIAIPKVQEQKAIGKLFNDLDKLIEFNKRQLNNYKSLQKLLTQRLFSQSWRFNDFTEPWHERKLGDVVNWNSGSGISKSELNVSGNNKVIHYADLYKMPAIITDINILHHSNANDGVEIPINSLLFPKSDVTPYGLARTSSINVDEVYAGNDVLIGTINKEYSSNFLSFQINCNRNDILKYITGSTVRHVSSSSLSNLDIQLPMLLEQQKIGKLLSSVDKLISKQADKIKQLELLKKYLMQKMFV